MESYSTKDDVKTDELSKTKDDFDNLFKGFFFKNEDKLTQIDKILFYSAGATFNVISACDKYEQDKYKALGFVIIFNYSLGFISGGFFGYSLSNSILMFVPAGFICATGVFAIENILLRTMEKNHSLFTRILLSLCLGLLISIPLEDIILDELIENQVIKEYSAKKENIEKNANSNLKELNEEVKRVNGEKEAKEKFIYDRKNTVIFHCDVKPDASCESQRNLYEKQKIEHDKWLEENKKEADAFKNRVSGTTDSSQKDMELIGKVKYTSPFSKVGVMYSLALRDVVAFFLVFLVKSILLLVDILPITTKKKLLSTQYKNRIDSNEKCVNKEIELLEKTKIEILNKSYELLEKKELLKIEIDTSIKECNLTELYAIKFIDFITNLAILLDKAMSIPSTIKNNIIKDKLTQIISSFIEKTLLKIESKSK